MKKIKKYALIIVIILVTIFCFMAFQKSNDVRTQTFFLQKVKDLKELTVVEYNYNGKLIDKKGNKSFEILTIKVEIPSTWSEVAILYDMAVKASVDLSSIDERDIIVKGETININLKKPYISCAEPSNIEVMETNGIFVGNKNYKDVANIYNENMKNLAKEASIKDGIMERAEKNAHQSIEELVNKMNPKIKNVNINFKE